MKDVAAYLEHYFQTAEQLAVSCSISTSELANLVHERLVPEPSYTVSEDDRFISQAFGEFKVSGLALGQHFHPGNAVWVTLALELKNKIGPEPAQLKLKDRFKQNFSDALKELSKSTFHLPDSFTDSGVVIKSGLEARAEKAWEQFLGGIFSLCVADPTSEKSIARKEILQEALAALSENGLRINFSVEEKTKILTLVDQYTSAAMPFSPIEYPRSSRKRLVEDLKARLGA